MKIAIVGKSATRKSFLSDYVRAWAAQNGHEVVEFPTPGEFRGAELTMVAYDESDSFNVETASAVRGCEAAQPASIRHGDVPVEVASRGRDDGGAVAATGGVDVAGWPAVAATGVSVAVDDADAAAHRGFDRVAYQREYMKAWRARRRPAIGKKAEKLK